jgi:hypothetical protein
MKKLLAAALSCLVLSSAVAQVPNQGGMGVPNSAPGSSISTPVSVANGGTGDTGTAWTAYTPTITCGSGTASGSTPTGFFKTIGKTTFVRLVLTTTTTTCASPVLGLPNTSQAGAVLSGREFTSTGAMFICSTLSSAANCAIWGTAGSGAGALSGATYIFGGVYDSQ